MAHITYFGKLADVTGKAEDVLSLPAGVTDTESLRRWIDTLHGSSGAFLSPVNRIALNDAVTHEPFAVSDHDRIAFLPPVGGG